jgi:hypothetical protein
MHKRDPVVKDHVNQFRTLVPCCGSAEDEGDEHRQLGERVREGIDVLMIKRVSVDEERRHIR